MCRSSAVKECKSCQSNKCSRGKDNSIASIKVSPSVEQESSPNTETEIIETEYSVENVLDVHGLLQAYSLVYNRYIESRYIQPNSSGIRVSGFELLPDSETYVVRNRSHFIISTATLVLDSEGGLPLDTVFPEEANSLRRKGRTLAEGSMFANNPISSRVEAAEANLILLASTLRKCQSDGIDTYLVVVNPKHAMFWEKFAGFKRLSTVSSCAHVKGNPGILYGIDVPTALDQESKISQLIATVEERYVSALRNSDKSIAVSRLITFLLKKDPQTILGIPKNLFRSIVSRFNEVENSPEDSDIDEVDRSLSNSSSLPMLSNGKYCEAM